MQIIIDTEDPAARALPLSLLSLLLNYNRFEFQNPYRQRLEELGNRTAINAVLENITVTCALCRDQYAAAQEDIAEGWNLSGALSWFGLGVLTGTPQTTAVTDEAANVIFSAL